VTSEPLGARILLDGAEEPVASTPARLSLVPGHHVLRLLADGCEPPLAYLVAHVGRLWGIGLLLGALVARPSHAQPTERDAARLHEEGRVAYDEGDFERARDRFRAALELFPYPMAMLSLGLAAERLGDAAEAVRWLEAYLASGPVSDATSLRARVERLRRTPVEVRVTSEPLGARILLDGAEEPVASTPARLSLVPGHHVLRLLADGYEQADRGVDVRLGERPEIALTLRALPTRLAVVGEGEVFVDEVSVGEAPWEGEVAPGPHTVRIADATARVTAVRGERTEVALARSAPSTDPIEPASAASLELDLFLVPAIQLRMTSVGSALFAPRGRIGFGLRLGRGPTWGVVGLDASVGVIGLGDGTTWTGAMSLRGAVGGTLGPIELRFVGAFGLAVLGRGDRERWLPALDPARAGSEPPDRILEGASVRFELPLDVPVGSVGLVVVPLAIELTVLNPFGLLAIAPAVGVRFR
jgi:hypothetical protein